MPAPALFNLAALFQSIVTIAFGALLAFYASRYWKGYEARKKEQDEATSKLLARSETADNERQALRADSDKNKAEHERFIQTLQEMRAATQLIQNDVQSLKMDAARSDMRNEGFKETLGRIDGQLGRLIDNYRSLS